METTSITAGVDTNDAVTDTSNTADTPTAPSSDGETATQDTTVQTADDPAAPTATTQTTEALPADPQTPAAVAMSKPTVGRIVHYFPLECEFHGNDSSPLPAVIVRVWSDDCVNLKIFTDGPVDVWRTSVMRRTDADTDHAQVWDWPPRS